MKLSYDEQMKRLINAAEKRGDKLAEKYYRQRWNGRACASYETFIKSWAGQQWLVINS